MLLCVKVTFLRVASHSLRKHGRIFEILFLPGCPRELDVTRLWLLLFLKQSTRFYQVLVLHMGASNCSRILWLFIVWRPPPAFPLITSAPTPSLTVTLYLDLTHQLCPQQGCTSDRDGRMWGYFTIWRRDPLGLSHLCEMSLCFISGTQLAGRALLTSSHRKKKHFYDILVHVAKKKNSVLSLNIIHLGEADSFYLYVYNTDPFIHI